MSVRNARHIVRIREEVGTRSMGAAGTPRFTGPLAVIRLSPFLTIGQSSFPGKKVHGEGLIAAESLPMTPTERADSLGRQTHFATT